MKAFCTDGFMLPLPPEHSFPGEKYRRLRERVADAGLVAPEDLRIPREVTDEELLRVHTPGYVERVMTGTLAIEEVRAIGFPWSPELVVRSRRSCGATVEAAHWALRDGVAVNLAGGTHHAFADRGGGYCVFNDAAVAARALQAEGLARRIVILDADVHQGDGTAAIFADDPTVYTFSLHGARNYPLRKQRSDLDIELADGATDGAYLDGLLRGLARAIPEARADLAVYLAGADPHEGDRLGRLKVSALALAERDRLVFEHCARAGLPVVMVMAGGYGRELEPMLRVQVNTVAAAAHAATRWAERTAVRS